jgi:hypothetical protein
LLETLRYFFRILMRHALNNETRDVSGSPSARNAAGNIAETKFAPYFPQRSGRLRDPRFV